MGRETTTTSGDARLVFATTTSVPTGATNRIAGDELAYNAIARGVMERFGISVNDLHQFADERVSEFQKPSNVHYTEAGNRLFAERVAAVIHGLL